MSAADSKRWSNLVFAGLFVLAIVLFSRILLPFLMPVLLGGFLVVLFFPIQDFLARRIRGHMSVCATLSTLTVFLLILLPQWVIATLNWLFIPSAIASACWANGSGVTEASFSLRRR